MELDNFFKSVMPVADYFDQSDILTTVSLIFLSSIFSILFQFIQINGERAPSEVYKDFRVAVLDILQTQENKEAVLNGVAGIGNGIDEIPGRIVSVDTAPRKSDSARETATLTSPPNTIDSPVMKVKTRMNGSVGKNVIEVETIDSSEDNGSIPPIIFVLGGPGSNKYALCLKAAAANPGWATFR